MHTKSIRSILTMSINSAKKSLDIRFGEWPIYNNHEFGMLEEPEDVALWNTAVPGHASSGREVFAEPMLKQVHDKRQQQVHQVRRLSVFFSFFIYNDTNISSASNLSLC